MGSCIGVAHASLLGAFQAAFGRREAANAAVRKQQKATGPSSNGMALGQVDMDAKEAEFEIASFFKLPKAERWEIIRHLQRYYQDGAAVASREAVDSSTDGDMVTMNGATVVATDVLASNGVLHVIGAVLLPPSP
jgi:hypothetical protein